MNTQFKKGVLELCVLVLASRKDCYGYELVHQISGKFSIAEGTVYPLLRRLTKDGHFSTYLVDSSEGPSRKYYRLTSEGRAHMDALLMEWKTFISGVNQLIEGETIE